MIRTSYRCPATSLIILGALTDSLQHAWAALVHLRTVRWVVAVPSVAPETPPSGTWGDLLPASIVGQLTRLPGDPVSEALTRARHLLGQLATLGIEPAPTLLSASAIRIGRGCSPLRRSATTCCATCLRPTRRP